MSHKVLKCVNKVETGEFKQGGTGGFSLGSSAHIWGQETHNILAFLLLLGWHWLEFTMHREFEYQSVSVQRYNTLGCCILSSIMLALLSFHSPWQWPPGDKETSVAVPYFNAKLFAQLTISTCKGKKWEYQQIQPQINSQWGCQTFDAE